MIKASSYVFAFLFIVTACGASESTSASSGGAPPSNVSTKSGGGDDKCHGPGRYQVGKEGGYLPCCEGLKEIFNLSPSQGESGAPICHRLPLRDFSCVKGTCGDGVCEPGESDHCGCTADCPSANWGPAQP